MFNAPSRNYEGIFLSELRQEVDEKYNLLHDELSDCYYNKKPFRNYGVLTQEQFDKLHGLIFLMRDEELFEKHKKLPIEKQVKELEIDIEDTRRKINQIKSEGFDLEIK